MLSGETVSWLRDALALGEVTRGQLARGVCERENWRNNRGQLCLSSAGKGLGGLAAELGLPLPEPRGVRPQWGLGETLPEPEVEGSLAELGAVRLRRIARGAERALWRRMLEECHPQGQALAPGTRVSYLVESAVHGVLGGLSMVASSWHCAVRDRKIGWSERARVANLQQVVTNDRFLLLPGVRVPNLASHVLGQAARRLQRDWQRAAGVEAVLVTTCVERGQRGTCYRAAGWKRVAGGTAQRQGSAREREAWRKWEEQRKRWWFKELRTDWQAELCREPASRLGRWPALAGVADSAGEFEFGRSDLADGRLRRRLRRMGDAWLRGAGVPIPEMFPGRAQQKAAYRFLHNGKVGMESILEPHREALLERMRGLREVLLVQDTTSVNLDTSRDVIRGLGRIGGGGKRESEGLWVHAGVVFTPGGCPLGVADLQIWARPFRQRAAQFERSESERWMRGFERACELGRLCPGTRVISVCDREADNWELFERQAERAAEAGLLVRASRGRERKARGELHGAALVQDLWQRIETLPPLVTGRPLRIAARGGRHARKQRDTTTEIRIDRIEMLPPLEASGSGPLSVIAAQVRDSEPPPDEDQYEWMLVSSEGRPDAAHARRLVACYETRWCIEEFFRLLKSGLRVEDRRLQTFDSLSKAMVFDAVTACKLFEVRRVAEEDPERPAEQVLPEEQIECLAGMLRERRILPRTQRGQERAVNARTLCVHIGRLVGFIPSRRQPLPGHMKLWKGLCRLHLYFQAWTAARRGLANPVPSPSG